MTLPYDALLNLARGLLAGVPSVSFGDELPRRKETNARRVHAAHLPAEERVVVLYDMTGFGTGDEGYLVTPVRLCWHDFAQPARMLLWSEVRSISALADKLHVNDMVIPVGATGASASASLFWSLAASAVDASTGTPH